MTKNELKKMMKPLVKQCLQEMMLEEGLLSKLIGEVMKGQNVSVISESRSLNKPITNNQSGKPARLVLNEERKKLADKIAVGAYQNIFEGVTPTTDPNGFNSDEDGGDPGIDLSMLSRVGIKSFK